MTEPVDYPPSEPCRHEDMWVLHVARETGWATYTCDQCGTSWQQIIETKEAS